MVGAAAVTVTVKVQAVPTLAEVSVGVQVTVVAPSEKVDPFAGTQTNVAPGQLSLTTGFAKVTGVVQPAVKLVEMFAGQAMVGAWASLIVMVKVQALVSPAPSVAVQVTIVAPWLKVLPLAGTQTTAGETVQLSVAVGLAHATLDLAHRPESVLATMFTGQVMEGACVSLMVTVNVQPLVLPLASITMQFTVVMPTKNVEPLDGMHTVLLTEQLSAVVTAQVTLVFAQAPVSATPVMFAGQVMVGA